MSGGARVLTLAGAAAALASCNAILGAQPPNAVDWSATDSSTDGADATATDAGDATASDGGAEADACVANLQTDVHTCGRCGHDCVGGACMSGLCQPMLVYSAPDTPSSIAVMGSTIFVTAELETSPTSGHVFRCSPSACAATKADLATNLRTPIFGKLLGSTLFWTNSGTTDDAGTLVAPGSVASCPTTGCSDGGPQTYGGDGGLLAGLAVDSQYVYWADLTSGEVDECATAGCNVTALSKGGIYGPFDVSVDPTYVYWTDTTNEEVLRCALPSCSKGPQLFASAQQFVWGIAVHGGNVYWTLSDTMAGAVMWCPESGCGAMPNVLAPNQAEPYFIAADDSGVYWTNPGDGTVMACPGGSSCQKPVAVATGQPAPVAIALDDVSIYFTNSSLPGNVKRVAKP